MVIGCAIIALLAAFSIVRGQPMMTEKIPLGKSSSKETCTERDSAAVNEKWDKIRDVTDCDIVYMILMHKRLEQQEQLNKASYYMNGY